MPSFTHLHIHTEFSIVDGIVRLDALMDAVISRGMHTVALTDFCNLFAVVKFFKMAVAKGIKPLIGCDLPCHDPVKPDEVYSLIFLCQNMQGYKNLTRLVSRAYLEGQHQGAPYVHLSWLPEHTEGVIVLSGGRSGMIGKALLQDNEQLAEQCASQMAELFPNRFYLEIQRIGYPHEERYNHKLVKLAEKLELPLVATNAVRFMDSTDFDAHEARVCIHDGYVLNDNRRTQAYTAEQYFRSAQEMTELFQDLPEALANTVIIGQRCSVHLDLGHNYLPNFPVPQGTTMAQYLTQVSQAGLNQRLSIIFRNQSQQSLEAERPRYEQRLNIELQVILDMGFAGYFLIVADFIQWAKNNGVPVGPGRGSGAGSLVAYALGITDLDPLQYDLLFERFLNPERVSMPDFDIDFCMEGRDRVIEYVAQKYGRQSVSQIITFGTMAAKAVIRDVGRVQGHPYGFVDKIAKLIPFEIGMTLTKALAQEAELQNRYHNETEVRELIDLAKKLEGITRNAGKHAGGVVIAPSQLTDFTAIYCEQGSTQLVSQLDKDDVEAAGLVKFDFLGLRTLTIIDWALQIVNRTKTARGEALIDIALIAMDDSATYDLLKACKTTAVFQLESRGMKELIHRLQPDCFEEIIALVALFRPGPLQSGMVDDFIQRKHGQAVVEYPHPDLENILKPTYGVILYQEQVMQIAQVLANYTLGAADLLRRAMGKKKPEEMAEQRQFFITGATARGVDAEVATHIFDLMEKFAGYGFNKSHSAAYALLAYQTAWLKAHFPAAFMAAVLSADLDNTDKLVHLIQECKSMALTIIPPCIHRSSYYFTVLDDKTIVYGLGAIKGVGEAVVNAIVAAREKGGNFKSIFDFCQRLDLRKLNRRVLEAFIKSGAMDVWQESRASLEASLDSAVQYAGSAQHNRETGQFNLFDLLDEQVNNEPSLVQASAWSTAQRLRGEQETLGFFLTGHPAMTYSEELKAHVKCIGSLANEGQKKVWVCALVRGIKRVFTKTGKKITILSLEDQTGQCEGVVFEKLTESLREPIQSEQVIVVEADIGYDNFNGGIRLLVNQVLQMDEARVVFGKMLTLTLDKNHVAQIDDLEQVLQAHPGHCPVRIHYSNAGAKIILQAGKSWRVTPSDTLRELLQKILGENNACYL